MADITAALAPDPEKKFLRAKWLNFTASDTNGTAIYLGGHPDRSVQVLGNFGTGGAITIQGSNDGGTTWATLNDPFGNALVITSAGIKGICELTQMIRPIRSAGTGAVALDVYLFLGGNTE